MGKHELALKYAQAAVAHCREALDDATPLTDAEAEAEAEGGKGEPYPAGSEGGPELGSSAALGHTLRTLAVACYNLAVEVSMQHLKRWKHWEALGDGRVEVQAETSAQEKKNFLAVLLFL